MKERPIIMDAESIRATLDGRKTMTRIVVKPQPPEGWNLHGYISSSTDRKLEDKVVWAKEDSASVITHGLHAARFPYGHIGDRLWVRETWKPGAWRDDGRVAIDYLASPELKNTPWIFIADQLKKFFSKWIKEVSDSGLIPNDEGMYEWEPGMSPLTWKSPMCMPRWASRTLLEITDIRVERLQDISEEDAKMEGPCQHDDWPDVFYYTWKEAYKELWNSNNSKRGFPWESNPWVWVIKFKVVEAKSENEES